jgi:hypothetical protein
MGLPVRAKATGLCDPVASVDALRPRSSFPGGRACYSPAGSTTGWKLMNRPRPP